MAAKKLTDILPEDPGERFTLAFYDFRKVIEGVLNQLPEDKLDELANESAEAGGGRFEWFRAFESYVFHVAHAVRDRKMERVKADAVRAAGGAYCFTHRQDGRLCDPAAHQVKLDR